MCLTASLTVLVTQHRASWHIFVRLAVSEHPGTVVDLLRLISRSDHIIQPNGCWAGLGREGKGRECGSAARLPCRQSAAVGSDGARGGGGAQGYTVPLDKRLAADGRGLQEVQINDQFAKLTEALYVAEGKAREAVDMRQKAPPPPPPPRPHARSALVSAKPQLCQTPLVPWCRSRFTTLACGVRSAGLRWCKAPGISVQQVVCTPSAACPALIVAPTVQSNATYNGTGRCSCGQHLAAGCRRLFKLSCLPKSS